MTYKIIASPIATKTYQHNIDFLEKRWSKREVTNFINKVSDVITILKQKPETFQKWENEADVRKIQIVKQITLYYQINKDKVELLLFFNNYQDPKTLQKLL